MTVDLAALAKLASEATPGPWGLDSIWGGSRGLVIGPLPADTDDPEWTTETVAFEIERDADAAYIAAASPDVVLALVRVALAAKAYLDSETNVLPLRAALADLDQ